MRGSNVSSHRPLSDRELVEQMPSPKVRPGARHGSADIFFEEPYVPSLPHGDRAGWGRSHGNARKPAGTQRSAPVLQPRVSICKCQQVFHCTLVSNCMILKLAYPSTSFSPALCGLVHTIAEMLPDVSFTRWFDVVGEFKPGKVRT